MAELKSSDVYVQKKSTFGKSSWRKNRLFLDSQGFLYLMNKKGQVKGRTYLKMVYRSMYLKPMSNIDQQARIERDQSDQATLIDRLAPYVLTLPVEKENGDKREMVLAFESIEQLCMWLRLFVSILGGRNWISKLIPESDNRWRVDSAIGYVSPYDTNWPENLEKWPYLWARFRTCYTINHKQSESKALSPVNVIPKSPTPGSSSRESESIRN